MTKKSTYTSQLLVSSLALTLLLGGMAVPGSISAQAANVSPGGEEDSAFSEAAAAEKPDARSEAGQAGEGRRKHGEAFFEDAAAIVGMDKAQLKTALKDKTLVQIAADNKISEADLLARLKTAAIKRIDAAVAAGKLPADKAESMKQRLDKHVKFMANHTLSELGKLKRMKHRRGPLPAPDKLAAMLGITADELHQQLKAGKSVAEIAQSKGISREQLVTKLKDELTPAIEQAIDRKRTDGAKPGK